MAVGVATVLYGATLRFRGSDWLWWVSAVSGTLSLATAFWADPRLLAGLKVIRRERVFRGLVGALLMTAATWVAFHLATRWAPALVSESLVLYDAIDVPPGRWAALPIIAVVVAAEEVIWRGLAVELVTGPGRSKAVVWILALGLYLLPQIVGGSLVLILLAAAAGAVWTAQRIWYGDLLTPFVTHLVWDVLIFVVFPLDGYLRARIGA